MRIWDIYTRINETLDSHKPLPYVQQDPTSWLINLGSNKSLVVEANLKVINSINVVAVAFFEADSFGNPNPVNMLTGAFNNAGAIRVFSTIIHIVSSLPKKDIIVCVPDDALLEIEGKKMNLYKMILRRLQRSRVLIRIGEIHGTELGEYLLYAIPPGSPVIWYNQEEIEKLLLNFVHDK